LIKVVFLGERLGGMNTSERCAIVAIVSMITAFDRV
jgi:hypothetical protein